MSKRATVSKSFIILLSAALSLIVWLPLNISSHQPTVADFCNSPAFYTEEPKGSVGYPFTFLEKSPQCVEVDPSPDIFNYKTVYGPYRVVISGLAADVAVWLSSTGALVLLMLGLRHNYRRNGWTRTTPPGVMAAVVLSGAALGAGTGLIPYENNKDGMHCYSIDGYDDPRGLPLQRGWPFPYYRQPQPACAEYRWIEAPDVCNGEPCRDYSPDPEQSYARPLLYDVAIGIIVSSAAYTAWRLLRRPRP